MGRGSWARCDRCDGAGFIDFGDEWEGGSREDCELCDALGIVEFPLTPDKILQLLSLLREEGDYLTDGYECVSDLTEGRCDHCFDEGYRHFLATEAHWGPPLRREDVESAYDRADPKRAALLDTIDRGVA